MLGTYGIDDEEMLLDELARQKLAAQKDIPPGTVGPAPEPMSFPELDISAPDDPMARLPALTPMPSRVDLTKAREADAQARTARGFETAARQAIGGLTLTKPVEATTPEGTAEQTALADEARARGDVLETRRGQMMERQRALEALLRPPPKVKTPEELANETKRADAGVTKANAYDKSVTKLAELGDQKLTFKEKEFLAKQEARRLGGIAAAKKAEEKAAAAKEKATLKSTEGLPFGYELREGANPSKPQREAATDAVEQRDAILPTIDRLAELTKAGPQRLADPRARAEVAQAAEQIGAAIRVIEKLGVPSGPDVQIGLRLIGDPNSPVNELAGTMPKLLANLKDYISNKAQTRLNVMGIVKSAKAGDKPTATVKLRQKSTGITKSLDPAAAAALVKSNTDFEVVP
jgi:hypothetical protein